MKNETKANPKINWEEIKKEVESWDIPIDLNKIYHADLGYLTPEQWKEFAEGKL